MHVPGWLVSLARRAPLGFIAGGAWLVAGGTAVIGNQAFVPAPEAAFWIWAVWWITLAAGILLFARGFIGVVAFAVHRGWLVSNAVREKGLPRVRVEWGPPEGAVTDPAAEALRYHENPWKRAAVTFLTWLYRRDEWGPGLSQEQKVAESAPLETYGRARLEAIGLKELAYERRLDIGSEPWWTPPAERPPQAPENSPPPLSTIAGPSSTAKSPVHTQAKREPPRFTVSPSGNDAGVWLTVRNQGPLGKFAAEVTAIDGDHLDADVEPRDLPWRIGWQGTGAELEIGPAQSGALTLISYDKAAADRLVLGRAKGFPYLFPGPDGTRDIYGNLAARHIRDLRNDVIRIRVHVRRIGTSETHAQTICVRWGVNAQVCE